ncbi:MAG: hypothetical protein U5N26_01590 [Candidatus Marinimicrobia bacterium]|nr:hypothetical protein [Candidatus Neomarinimicrobiota bacterium]
MAESPGRKNSPGKAGNRGRQNTYPPEEAETIVQEKPRVKTRDIPVDSKEVVIVNDKYAMVLSNLGGGTVRGYELFGIRRCAEIPFSFFPKRRMPA